MALFVWLRLTCCSMNRRLRLSIAAVSLPDSAADLSVRILLCRVASAVVFDLNSCKDGYGYGLLTLLPISITVQRTKAFIHVKDKKTCLLYTSPSPRD